MCGGIGFRFRNIPKNRMKEFFSDAEIERFERKGEAQSYFWSKRPVLPVENKGKTDLVDWGNREKDIKLPKTGWAKAESIDEGKWGYLKPEFVNIPAEKGYEKGVWFDIKGKGIKGLIIEKDKQKRAYMVTKQADQAYLKLTHHNREPIINK